MGKQSAVLYEYLQLLPNLVDDCEIPQTMQEEQQRGMNVIEPGGQWPHLTLLHSALLQRQHNASGPATGIIN